jgi:hypothetical protein
MLMDCLFQLKDFSFFDELKLGLADELAKSNASMDEDSLVYSRPSIEVEYHVGISGHILQESIGSGE